MHRSWGGKYGDRPYGWSPWMGFGMLVLLLLILSKGLFWPLFIVFIVFMVSRHHRGGWGCGSGFSEKSKRKNDEYDEYIEKPKRKHDDDDAPIYYA